MVISRVIAERGLTEHTHDTEHTTLPIPPPHTHTHHYSHRYTYIIIHTHAHTQTHRGHYTTYTLTDTHMVFTQIRLPTHARTHARTHSPPPHTHIYIHTYVQDKINILMSVAKLVHKLWIQTQTYVQHTKSLFPFIKRLNIILRL